jgi:hypothetical protein
MAKTKLGGVVGAVSGKLAGMVFSHNRSGTYVRQKTSPVQPRTTRQMTQRAIFTNVTKAWRTLSLTVQNQWLDWAANHTVLDVFGDPLKLQGNSAFVRVNATLQTLGLPSITTPPPDPTAPPPAATAATATGSTGVVTVTLATAPVATNIYAVYTTKGKSPGAQFVNPDYRLAAVETGGTTTTLTLTPGNLNPRLAFVAGQNVGVKIVRYSDAGVFIDSTPFIVTAA